MRKNFGRAAFFWVLIGGFGSAQDSRLPQAAKAPIDFTRDVEPLLKSRCQMCHGAVQQMGGLRLDSGEAALRGGYSGPVILPGRSAESRLIRLVGGLDEKVVMPPAGKRLSAAEVGILRSWIDKGAEWVSSAVSAPNPEAPGRRPVTHWSFQPIRRPEPPRVGSASWVRNPIDNFVLARLKREGVEPSLEAARNTLIRRVTLDLTGLPPKPEEVTRFLADSRPDAYERLVDRLLDSPHYGEKWARYWLDLARYSDSDGYEKDNFRPNAWRYRHWVIEALNRDMPFDQFTIEQLAGDLLPGATVEQKAATGFNRNTLTNREGGVNIEQFRDEQVMDRTSTIGAVWLGLTLGCAQCHDHKYDPITQKEFYQIFAFFNNADELDVDAPLAGELGPYLAARGDYRRKRKALLDEYRVHELQRDWEANIKEAAAHPGQRNDWDRAYGALQVTVDHGDEILNTDPAQRSERYADQLTDYFISNYRRVISSEKMAELKFSELAKKLRDLATSFPDLSRAPTLAERPLGRKSYIHLRGDYRSPGIEIQPAVLSFLHAPPPDTKPTRLTLARWLVSKDNPLTARVFVNRMWQELFGRGLSLTSEDFGLQGQKPSHPDLLDWLAANFVENGWGVKRLHRFLVTSATYRQSSKARVDLAERDPDNVLLARQARLRLPAESIRDSALAASDLLYPEIGGRSIRPSQPKGVVDLSFAGNVKWNESTGKDRYRRGMYIVLQRTIPYPQLANFNAPSGDLPVCRRERSNTPLQALNLLNDPVFTEAAQALAARTLQQAPADLHARVRYAFQVCLVRQPSASEVESLSAYYRDQVAIFEKDPKAASDLFPAGLPGHNHIETAAWTGVASVLLNLDEFITRE